MAGDRRINWGADATDARYRTEDTGDGGNFVVAEDLDGNTVLLQWNPSTSPSQWEFAGKVDMGDNDLVNVNSLDAGEIAIGDTLNEVRFGLETGVSAAGKFSPSSTASADWEYIDLQMANKGDSIQDVIPTVAKTFISSSDIKVRYTNISDGSENFGTHDIWYFVAR